MHNVALRSKRCVKQKGQDKKNSFPVYLQTVFWKRWPWTSIFSQKEKLHRSLTKNNNNNNNLCTYGRGVRKWRWTQITFRADKLKNAA